MSRYMVSVSELQFADRDFLPDYMRGSERERRPYGADAAETQRFFGADNDFEYLCSSASRQEFEGLSVVTEEQLVGGWTELDAEEREDEAADEIDRMSTTLVTTSNLEPSSNLTDEGYNRRLRAGRRNRGQKVYRPWRETRATIRRA